MNNIFIVKIKGYLIEVKVKWKAKVKVEAEAEEKHNPQS